MKQKSHNKHMLWAIIAIIIVVAGIYYFIPQSEEMMVQDTDQTPTEGESIVIQGFMDVTAEEAKALIDSTPDLIIIDVSPHYATEHIPGAINYYPSSELQTAIPTLDKNAKYLVYCHADGPSRSGAQALVDAEFTNVYRLSSHFSGWKAAGYPTE